LHDVCICWLKHRGFTFSFRDITIPDKLDNEFRGIVDEAKVKIDDYLRSVTDPETGELNTDANKVEGVINQTLNLDDGISRILDVSNRNRDRMILIRESQDKSSAISDS